MASLSFSPEAEMALLGTEDDDNLRHLFPSSSCQSPPSILYSSPLGPTTGQTESPIPYSHAYEYRGIPSQLQPWIIPNQPLPPVHVSYSTYLPLTGTSSAPTYASHPIYNDDYPSTRPERSPSASSSGMLGYSLNERSDRSPPPQSRSISPSSPDLRGFGILNQNGTWSCKYPGCNSRAVFTRGCDLRKHYKRHRKTFFCHHEGCPQATGGGFSSKKDLARHEAKHNPGVRCDVEGCDRVFSRVDNMRDHVKRIHLKAAKGKGSPLHKPAHRIDSGFEQIIA
ncbi:hypothetical protein B0J11DRAFT_223 [Dendryphion nanum]|uniref:C2H2-type domain-containing protein n=1 Tax=Dendryphion nanum TaxID=256645 RepID=A0A9P9EIY5_9PLEO|nr:hypothetical protein B0J11DRAFT_223 [Dendryphion nanum]